MTIDVEYESEDKLALPFEEIIEKVVCEALS